MCTMAAFGATLLFESPFIGLEKIIFGRQSSVDKKTPSNNKETSVPYTIQKTQESTTTELGDKSEEINQASHRSSYRQKGFDNIAYEA